MLESDRERPPGTSRPPDLGSRVNPDRGSHVAALRIGGFLLTLVGGVLTAVGLISFFDAFGSMRPPRYFWCAFVGLPVLGLGLGLLRAGFLGLASRYVAGETVPVVADSIETVVDEVGPALRRAVSADPPGLNPEERLERLDQLLASGRIDEREHREQRERVLRDL